MIRDGQTTLWNAAALTVGTAQSTFSYDTGAQAVSGGTFTDNSTGEPLVFAVAVIVAAVTGNNETYEFDIINDSNANLATTVKTLAKYAIAAADASATLKAGNLLVLPLPPLPSQLVQRYLGLQAVLGVGTAAVTVTAWITTMAMVQTYSAYSSKIVVL